MMNRTLRAFFWTSVWLIGLSRLQAQWITQTFVVKPGWSAVYLNLDASYQNIDQLVGADPANPIVEVWYWQTPATLAQIQTLQTQPASSPQWSSWVRAGYTNSPGGSLALLVPNAAYLVHSIATTNFNWKIKGHPVAPSYSWNPSGLNFIGFPTSSTNPPTVSAFLAPAPTLAGWLQSASTPQRSPGIYRYPGGDLGANNPAKLPTFLWKSSLVTRGQAFWLDAGPSFANAYFGPFQVQGFSSSGGLSFGDTSGQSSFILKNVTDSQLTISAHFLSSEDAPVGQTPITGPPPLVFRGGLVTSNLTYPAIPAPVNGQMQWTLAPQGQPGSQLTVVAGVDRSALSGPSGSLYAGVLQFTDSLGLSEINIPVAAQSSSFGGLWVGNASITNASNFLKDYARDGNGKLIITNTSPTTSQYVVNGINTNGGGVSQAFPLRLILHSDGTRTVLLQRVFWGWGTQSNHVVATHESALDSTQLGTARRISSINFPWSQVNTFWPLGGPLSPGAILTGLVDLAYDDNASNPFIHTYHPDHDNLDSSFKQELNEGAESYGITRQVILSVSPPGNDFRSITTVGQSLQGVYQESVTLTGLNGTTRQFNASGSFSLQRISPISTLTTAP